jgi:hypothetical protein
MFAAPAHRRHLVLHVYDELVPDKAHLAESAGKLSLEFGPDACDTATATTIICDVLGIFIEEGHYLLEIVNIEGVDEGDYLLAKVHRISPVGADGAIARDGI